MGHQAGCDLGYGQQDNLLGGARLQVLNLGLQTVAIQWLWPRKEGRLGTGHGVSKAPGRSLSASLQGQQDSGKNWAVLSGSPAIR